MSRYIDKDKLLDDLNWHAPEPYKDSMSKYIDKDEAIRRFGELHGEENALLNCYNADWIESFLECQPEADVVKVVRCKDCKYCQDNNGGYPHIECRWSHDETPNEDDYCSYGERKENEQ